MRLKLARLGNGAPRGDGAPDIEVAEDSVGHRGRPYPTFPDGTSPEASLYLVPSPYRAQPRAQAGPPGGARPVPLATQSRCRVSTPARENAFGEHRFGGVCEAASALFDESFVVAELPTEPAAPAAPDAVAAPVALLESNILEPPSRRTLRVDEVTTEPCALPIDDESSSRPGAPKTPRLPELSIPLELIPPTAPAE